MKIYKKDIEYFDCLICNESFYEKYHKYYNGDAYVLKNTYGWEYYFCKKCLSKIKKINLDTIRKY